MGGDRVGKMRPFVCIYSTGKVWSRLWVYHDDYDDEWSFNIMMMDGMCMCVILWVFKKKKLEFSVDTSVRSRSFAFFFL